MALQSIERERPHRDLPVQHRYSNRDLQLMREAGSPWQVSVAVDPKLIGAVNLPRWPTRSPGKARRTAISSKRRSFRRHCCWRSRPVNVAGLAKIIPGWGSSSDFTVQPWFATLQAEHGNDI